jgi:hypothetical protein
MANVAMAMLTTSKSLVSERFTIAASRPGQHGHSHGRTLLAALVAPGTTGKKLQRLIPGIKLGAEFRRFDASHGFNDLVLQPGETKNMTIKVR